MADTNEFRHLLRRLRMERGWSQDALGAEVHITGSQVGHWEGGRSIPGEKMADSLDEVLGAEGELSRLAGTARGEAVAAWLRPWQDNERRATLLRTWEPTLVPGLLQTERYMRTVISAGAHTPDQVEEMVSIRLERQATTLDRQDPVTITAIIGEPALRYGSPDLMKEQIEYLLDVGSRPNVTVRVLPFSAGIHAGQSGPYVLAALPDGSTTAYIDDALEGRVIGGARDILRLSRAWEAVSARALPLARTHSMLQRIINEHEAELAEEQPEF